MFGSDILGFLSFGRQCKECSSKFDILASNRVSFTVVGDTQGLTFGMLHHAVCELISSEVSEARTENA